MAEHPKYELESIRKGTILLLGPRPRSDVKKPKIAPEAGYFVARHLFAKMGTWPSWLFVRRSHAPCGPLVRPLLATSPMLAPRGDGKSPRARPPLSISLALCSLSLTHRLSDAAAIDGQARARCQHCSYLFQPPSTQPAATPPFPCRASPSALLAVAARCCFPHHHRTVRLGAIDACGYATTGHPRP